MKGIILAGGSGTRLYPITKGVSKQLLPIYDKPLIYYPLSTLMLGGINDILVITTKEDQENFIRLLGDGNHFGVNLNYAIQEVPNGLAKAFTIGEDFIKDDECAMVLGDNIFLGSNLPSKFKVARNNALNGDATIFTFGVHDPERFGIAEIDENDKIISIEEKPANPKSDQAIVGLYYYPKGVSEKAKEVVPSKRGEYEITSLNDLYLKEDKLKVQKLEYGCNWYDAGLFDSMNDVSNHVRAIENNTDSIVCCPEEIAFKNGWLSEEELAKSAELMSKNSYGKYLKKVLMRNNTKK